MSFLKADIHQSFVPAKELSCVVICEFVIDSLRLDDVNGISDLLRRYLSSSSQAGIVRK
jgi:hypothetical protein